MAARAVVFTFAGFFVFAGVVAILTAAGSPVAGKTLAVVILAAPLVMLLLAGASKLIARKEPGEPGPRSRPQQTALVEQAKAFLIIAGYAVLAIVVLMASIAMTRSGEGAIDAAGWALIFGFGVLTVVPFGFLVLLKYAPLLLLGVLSHVGRRSSLYRGHRLFLQGRYSDALDSFRAYSSADPEESKGLIAQSAVLNRLRRYEEALAVAESAVVKGRSAEALSARAASLLSLGTADLALVDLEAARELNPRVMGGHILAAAALIKLRRLDEAIALLETEGFQRRTAASRLLLGEAYRLRDMAERASTAYKAAVKLAPITAGFDMAMGHGIWACALAELEKTDDAADHAEIALDLEPSNSVALYARALVELRRENLERLYATLAELIIAHADSTLSALTDPEFTPLLAEKRFRDLLAWALGAQRQARGAGARPAQPPA